MNRADFQTLLDFHYWARDRMLDALEPLTPEQFTRDLGSSFRSIHETVTHMYSGERVWYLRWQGTPPTAHVSPDQVPDVATLRSAWTELETKVRAFVAGLDDSAIDRVLSYTLFNGTPAASAMWQMLQHVVNHGSYHRGQVATMLRQLGAGPIKSTDMIAFYRERAS
jgi:uncharacterized damage-inducible protein DinB